MEIPDVNFFRDLCPWNRKFAKPNKEGREVQKSILKNYIEIEPNQQNLNEDMYLLALTGIVPIDKCKHFICLIMIYDLL